MSALVVDTSAWIDFFAGRSIPTLEDGLAHGAIVVPPIVLAELLSGARRGRERELLEDVLGELPLHETPRIHWVRVGDLRRELGSRGLALSTPDAHVAQCALDLGGVLLTGDAIFTRVARHVPLKTATA